MNKIENNKVDGIGFHSALISSIDIMSRQQIPIDLINGFCVSAGLSNKEIDELYDFVQFYQLIRKSIFNNLNEGQKK